ncbi:MAG: quercetin 2,3-dioxygenase [Candidatus Muproteobacteria bacterium RBG_16_62_13]|uniref:Quercetin 2,3-dioxygenase n=1 Tax=Candidatus Muproteobacteria bacterium RBG_16_62_13 TaxID=1817756 RepID=A0A1F6SX26_9PROT|nr:MAG: quercetin 2,3-dioxygenase [Candidatus Muproteobacteria bacterium RBG_16_62_13]
MIRVRKNNERGHANHGWLDIWHTFSFADYVDPEQMGVSVLLVINEDRVQPGQGFPTHGHRDMEIVSYVLDGALEHKDSMGNGSVIRSGDVQRMSAGTGVRHSEYNASKNELVHFLQIWILPDRANHVPGYEQVQVPAAELNGRLRAIASPDGREGSVTIHQDAVIYATKLNNGAAVSHALAPGRLAYLHVARGMVVVNGQALTAGDGARVEQEGTISLKEGRNAEVLLFDLPLE